MTEVIGYVHTACFFCGGDLAGEKNLAWLHGAKLEPEEGEEPIHQQWGAHLSCLLERISGDVRALGGPLVDP